MFPLPNESSRRLSSWSPVVKGRARLTYSFLFFPFLEESEQSQTNIAPVVVSHDGAAATESEEETKWSLENGTQIRIRYNTDVLETGNTTENTANEQTFAEMNDHLTPEQIAQAEAILFPSGSSDETSQIRFKTELSRGESWSDAFQHGAGKAIDSTVQELNKSVVFLADTIIWMWDNKEESNQVWSDALYTLPNDIQDTYVTLRDHEISQLVADTIIFMWDNPQDALEIAHNDETNTLIRETLAYIGENPREALGISAEGMADFSQWIEENPELMGEITTYVALAVAEEIITDKVGGQFVSTGSLAKLNRLLQQELDISMHPRSSLLPEPSNIKNARASNLDGNGNVCKVDQCFAAGTLVQTEDGLVPIEEIEIGSFVFARHERTFEQGYFEVVDTMVRESSRVFRLVVNSIAGEEEIIVTEEHPFYTERGWIRAGELQVNEEITTADNQSATVISLDEQINPIYVYNLTVREAHTYFVGEGRLWVHNTCGPCADGNAQGSESAKNEGRTQSEDRKVDSDEAEPRLSKARVRYAQENLYNPDISVEERAELRKLLEEALTDEDAYIAKVEKAHTLGNVIHIVELDNGLKAVFKLETGEQKNYREFMGIKGPDDGSLGMREAAVYHLVSRYLGNIGGPLPANNRSITYGEGAFTNDVLDDPLFENHFKNKRERGLLTVFIDGQEGKAGVPWPTDTGLHSLEDLSVLDFLITNIDRDVVTRGEPFWRNTITNQSGVLIPFDHALSFNDLNDPFRRENWLKGAFAKTVQLNENQIDILENFIARESEVRSDLMSNYLLTEDQLDGLFDRARFLVQKGETDFEGYQPKAATTENTGSPQTTTNDVEPNERSPESRDEAIDTPVEGCIDDVCEPNISCEDACKSKQKLEKASEETDDEIPEPDENTQNLCKGLRCPTSGVELPSILYRGDGRNPRIIFLEGFQPKGTAEDLERYFALNKPSNFVGTSKSFEMGGEFAGAEEGYLYIISPNAQTEGFDINEIYGTKHMDAEELEVAIRGGIPTKDIVGAMPVYRSGAPAGPLILNPNFVGDLDILDDIPSLPKERISIDEFQGCDQGKCSENINCVGSSGSVACKSTTTSLARTQIDYARANLYHPNTSEEERVGLHNTLRTLVSEKVERFASKELLSTEGHNNDVFLVSLPDGSPAIWKPVPSPEPVHPRPDDPFGLPNPFGHNRFQSAMTQKPKEPTVLREATIYQIDEFLGHLGGTLPVVVKTVDGQTGVLAPFIDNLDVTDVPLSSLSSTRARQAIHNGAIFDFITHNTDRYRANYGITPDGGVVPLDQEIVFKVFEPTEARIEMNSLRREGSFIAEMGGQTGKVPLTSEQRLALENFVQRQDEIRQVLRSNMTEAQLDELFFRTRYVLDNDGFDIEEYTLARYGEEISWGRGAHGWY